MNFGQGMNFEQILFIFAMLSLFVSFFWTIKGNRPGKVAVFLLVFATLISVAYTLCYVLEIFSSYIILMIFCVADSSILFLKFLYRTHKDNDFVEHAIMEVMPTIGKISVGVLCASYICSSLFVKYNRFPPAAWRVIAFYYSLCTVIMTYHRLRRAL